MENIHFLGVLRGQLLRSRLTEFGMPALEGRVQIAIQHLDSHLQQQMSAARRPSDLLLFDNPFGDDLIDS